MPQSSGSAHTQGESQQSGVSQGLAPQPQASMEAPELAQAALSARGSRNRLATSSEHQVFVREPEDEDDLESVNEFPVDKTFNRSISFIYEQYPDSHPISDPAVPPRCVFESFFAL